MLNETELMREYFVLRSERERLAAQYKAEFVKLQARMRDIEETLSRSFGPDLIGRMVHPVPVMVQ